LGCAFSVHSLGSRLKSTGCALRSSADRPPAGCGDPSCGFPVTESALLARGQDLKREQVASGNHSHDRAIAYDREVAHAEVQHSLDNDADDLIRVGGRRFLGHIARNLGLWVSSFGDGTDNVPLGDNAHQALILQTASELTSFSRILVATSARLSSGAASRTRGRYKLSGLAHSHGKHRGPYNPPRSQTGEGVIGLLKRESLDVGSNRDLWCQGHELVAVAAGQVGD
jgi:hypothetical protein